MAVSGQNLGILSLAPYSMFDKNIINILLKHSQRMYIYNNLIFKAVPFTQRVEASIFPSTLLLPEVCTNTKQYVYVIIIVYSRDHTINSQC